MFKPLFTADFGFKEFNIYKEVYLQKISSTILHFHYFNNQKQSSVAKWLRQGVSLAVTLLISHWEVVGLNPTAGMSRLGLFFSREEISMVSLPNNVSYLFSTQQDHLVAYLWACVIVVK